ncbi:MAG: cytochrome c3 family protein [Dehalococcoidales bacterium]
MKTLLEFITLTKGVEYLIAIAFLFGFIAFWQLAQHGGKRLVVRVVPAFVLMLGIGTLASTCVIQETVTNPASPAGEVPLLSSPVLVEMYKPASFNHEAHQRFTTGCSLCHHHSEDATPPCKECHATPFDPENLNKPGITRVYHLRCISCHTEQQMGPTECIGCHNKATIPPLSIAHPLTGKGNCLSCHKNGVAGVPGLPADHDSATNGVCQLCHQPMVAETAMATRQLPHEVTGREDCLLCHGEGIGGAAKVPADHAGRTNETCQVCHK